MWFIILSIIILVVGLIFCYNASYSEWRKSIDYEDFAMFSFIWLFVGSIALLIIGAGMVLPCTTGLDSDYLKNGEAVGYITHFKQEGIIWKTWEGKYLAGVGKQTAVGGAYSFSVVDDVVVKQIKVLVGSDVRVKMTYDCWLMLPYKMGSSNCLVTKIGVENETNSFFNLSGTPAPVDGLRVRPCYPTDSTRRGH